MTTRLVRTREGLRALACYVIAPARYARDGHIGLRATGDGFATPAFDDATRVLVRGDQIFVEPDRSAPISTVRAAAVFVGVELSARPPVGRDLPPFEPDRHMEIDAAASFTLGEWWALGDEVLAAVRGELDEATVSETQLWPEHFDIAITVELPGGVGINVGFSPGDAFLAEPYVYVGPHDMTLVDRDDSFWNAPFGAVLARDHTLAAADPQLAARSFIAAGLHRCRSA